MIRTSLEDIRHHILEELKIKKDEIVFYFTSIRDFGHINFRAIELLDLLNEIHADGAYVLPTFSYSWNNGRPFQPDESPAPEMGYISNTSIGKNGFYRTNHPNFSVNIFTKQNFILKELLENETDTFGPSSFFYNMYIKFPNSRIVLLGGPFKDCLYRSTFIHTAQQLEGAWYRYLKRIYSPDKQQYVTQYSRYLSREEFENHSKLNKQNAIFPIIENFSEYAKDLFDEGLLQTFNFKMGYTRQVFVGSSIDFFRTKIQINKNYGLIHVN